MERFADWWSARELDAEWRTPIKSVQGFRPVGGYLIGTATHLEFVPNRLEAMVGAKPWTAATDDIQDITLGRRRLRIVSAGDSGGTHTLYTNRPGAVRKHLGALLHSAR